MLNISFRENLLFHKTQPSINQMSEKFHCYVCPNFCLLRARIGLNETNTWLEFSIRGFNYVFMFKMLTPPGPNG